MITPIEIKQIRLDKGLTWMELAVICQCSFQTIWRWENGVSAPRSIYERILKGIQAGQYDAQIEDIKKMKGEKEKVENLKA